MAAAGAAAKLAIATAGLTAALLRPDPDVCTRHDMDSFRALLDAATTRCSPGNVQACKQWILQLVARSPGRTSAVARYLAALADSFSPAPALRPSPKTTSARRKRLHLLYILSDTLYHTAVRDHNEAFAHTLAPLLPQLVRSAASFAHAPKQLQKIRALLDLWSDQGYFSPETLAQLWAAVDQGSASAATDSPAGTEDAQRTPSSTASLPFVLPASHGDPSMPWYDLPAATWLAALEPNSTRPMKPADVRPQPLVRGPAPSALVDSVQKLLADVQRIFGPDGVDNEDDDAGMDEERVADDDAAVDAMGERVELDAFTGDILDGDTYYGWSRAFCQKMRARRLQKGKPSPFQAPPPPPPQGEQQRRRRSPSEADGSGSRGRRRRSRSRSRSSDGSRGPAPAFKRRRVSRSRSRSRSFSRSRTRSTTPPLSHLRVPSRSRRRSASPSRHRDDRRHGRHDHHDHHDRHSRSPYSPQRSHDEDYDYQDDHGHSDRRHRHHRRDRSVSRSGSRSRTPYSPSPPPPPPPVDHANTSRVSFPNMPNLPNMPIPPPFYTAALGNLPPLPPPPNYKGQWPPPLPFPPPPPGMMAGAPAWGMPGIPMPGMPGMPQPMPGGLWGAWPPPPPQQHSQSQPPPPPGWGGPRQ